MNKIHGWKTFKSTGSASHFHKLNLDNDDLAIMIFFKEFTYLGTAFFEGHQVYIKKEKIYFEFLEKVIKQRLDDMDLGWKENSTEELKSMLRKGDRLVDIEFLHEKYEVNTFGYSKHLTILSLLDLYSSLNDSLEGLIIVPDNSELD